MFKKLIVASILLLLKFEGIATKRITEKVPIKAKFEYFDLKKDQILDIFDAAISVAEIKCEDKAKRVCALNLKNGWVIVFNFRNKYIKVFEGPKKKINHLSLIETSHVIAIYENNRICTWDVNKGLLISFRKEVSRL